MNAIVAALCLLSVVYAGELAARYPAGVSPAACPNYPYCDPLVDPTSGHVRAYAGDYTYARAHYAPYAYTHPVAAPIVAAAPYYGYNHAAAIVAGAAKEYPAGVDPALCPNYPDCSPHHVTNLGIPASVAYARSGHYGHHLGGARYPAGVDPAACPNYPFCAVA